MISQNLEDTITTYRIGNLEIIADNVSRTVPDNENLKDGSFRAWCEGDVRLKTQLNGKYFNASGHLGKLTSNSEWTISADGRLIRSTVGQIRLKDGTLYPFEDEMTCTRKSPLLGI